MKNANQHKRKTWLAIVFGILLWMFWLTFQTSDDGLAISAHISLRRHCIDTTAGVCTGVEIGTKKSRLAPYTRSTKMVYDFYLDNGETFRICCVSLENDSISEEELQALIGNYITVEYCATRFLHLHGDVYPLISIKNQSGVIISDDIAVKYLMRSWNGTQFWLFLLGGSSIAITLFNIFVPLIKKHRKKAKIRRKKVRRKLQLEERMRKTESAANDKT